MTYDWHATFPLEEAWDQMVRDTRHKDLIEALARKLVAGEGPFPAVCDLYARLHLLAQSIDDRTAKGEWSTQVKGVHSSVLLGGHYAEYARGQLRDFGALGFATPRLTEPDLARLPENSFFLYVPLTLATPYISRDDEPFYVHENPVRKDHVLKVPIVASTGWKGAFRAALRRTLPADDDDDRVTFLLGNAKGEGGEAGGDLRRGRLSFYPTFFDDLAVQVINPHLRETSAGDKPIHIESVPRKAKGTFALLYTPLVPRDSLSALPTWEEVLTDLDRVGRATRVLLADLGFGAKTGSGMGRAEDEVSGAYLLVHRWIETLLPLSPPPPGERPPQEFVPDDPEFLDPEGNWPHYETNAEMEAHVLGNAARRRYKRQRIAYRGWLRAREPWAAWEREVSALKEQTTREMLRLNLARLGEFDRLAELVKGGGDG